MGRRSTGTLDLHGAKYRLRVQLPKHLRTKFGGQHSLVAMLPTDSKAHAYRMKAGLVTAMLNQIQQAEREFAASQRSDPIDKKLMWAEWISKVLEAEKNGKEYPGIELPQWLRLPYPKNSRQMRLAFWCLHKKEAEEMMPRYEAFKATVEGDATPVESPLEQSCNFR